MDGDLFVGLGLERVRDGGQLGPDGEGRVLMAKFLFERGDVVERVVEEVVFEIAGDSAAEEGEGIVEAALGAQPAREADHFGGVGEPLGVADGDGDDGGQAGEGEHVDGVVVEDGLKRVEIAGAEELEVEIGDESTVDVAVSLDAENAGFEFFEAAAFQGQPPKAAGGV